MKPKDKYKIAGVAIIAGLILLYLLWRKNTPQKEIEIKTVNNKEIVQVPVLSTPIIGNSCGCNPQASQFLNGRLESIKKVEQNLDQQLKDYTDSINNYFATQVFQ